MSRADRVTRTLIEHVGPIAEACDASAIFVYVDAVGGGPLDLPPELESKIVYVTKTEAEQEVQESRGTAWLRVPDVPLTRMGQLKVAIFQGLFRGLVHHGDVIVCLAGIAESGSLDTLVVTEVGREFEMYSSSAPTVAELPANVQPEVVERVIDLASEVGSEGREGKPVGTIFVIADADHVLPLSRQLILNPFQGYPEEKRNILDPALEETIKELSTLDGAIIIRGDGTLVTCGAHLKTASQDEYELPQGLGARHHAAAAITSVTDSLAVTVSESTGTVTVFRRGKIVTEIEKPRRSDRHHRRYEPDGERP